MTTKIRILEWGCVGLLAIAVGLAPARAGAQTDQQKQQMKEHYDRATRFYDVGKYAEAIEAYQKAYELGGDPVLLYNIAQAYRLADQPADAARFYKNYLRRSPNAPNRADAMKKMEEAEKLAEERRRVSTAPPSGYLPPAAGAPPQPVNPAAPPAPPPPLPSPAVGTPPPAGVQAPPPSTTPPPAYYGAPTEPPYGQPPPTVGVAGAPGPAPTASSRGRKLAAYALMAGGGVLLIVAVIEGSIASGKASDLEKAAAARQTFDPALESSGKTASTIAVVTGIIGVGAAATGLVLALTAPKPAVTAAAVPSRRAPRVVAAPIVGAQMLGAVAAWIF